MSDIATLTKENDDLKKQLEQNSKGVENLLAQLDACKQMLNEGNNNSLALRTNFNIVYKQNKELGDKNQALQMQINTLNKQLCEATQNATN